MANCGKSGGWPIIGSVVEFCKRPKNREDSSKLDDFPTRIFSTIFRIFRKLFVNFVLSNFFPEIGHAEMIRLVHKSSNFELSPRFFGRLKIFIGQGSLYSLEPIFQTLH